MKKDDASPSNPITPQSEAIYLEFAEAAREEFAAKNLDYLSFDQEWRPETSAAALAAQQRLLPLIPEYWPRRLLQVFVDGNRVQLSRGSGLLGQVGVMIYDQGPVVLHTPEELEKNFYLPNQKRITGRLWFFTSG